MLSLDNFLQYYNSQEFKKGMLDYFKVETENGHPVIKDMDWRGRTGLPDPHFRYYFIDDYLNEQGGGEMEKEKEENKSKSIYFATIFFYVAMCNYTITKLLGEKSLHDFLKATQWPMTRFGQSGICPPHQTLQEADLVFMNGNVTAKCQEALALFREVVPFMKDELNKFFSGKDENLNQTAYDAFCKAIAGKVDEFWQIADPLIEEFTFYKQ
jgi:hypothetical protein